MYMNECASACVYACVYVYSNDICVGEEAVVMLVVKLLSGRKRRGKSDKVRKKDYCVCVRFCIYVCVCARVYVCALLYMHEYVNDAEKEAKGK